MVVVVITIFMNCTGDQQVGGIVNKLTNHTADIHDCIPPNHDSLYYKGFWNDLMYSNIFSITCAFPVVTCQTASKKTMSCVATPHSKFHIQTPACG